MSWWRRLFRRRGLEGELDAELRHHLEAQVRDYIRAGMSEEAARRKAALDFGGLDLAKEECRDVRRLPILEGIALDLRYSGRALMRGPSFAAGAVLTLALGIGASTAIFSLVDHLLVRNLPYPEDEELVMVYETSSAAANHSRTVSPANFLDWKLANRSFEYLAAWAMGESTLRNAEGWERIDGQFVTPDFFRLLGVEPAIGRTFTADDAPTAVILSHGLWQRQFGGDPNPIGRSVDMEGVGREVIGVMPPGFGFVSTDADFWMQYRVDTSRDWRALGGTVLYVVGRLNPGVAPSAAEAEMRAIAAGLAERYPSNDDPSVTVVSLREELFGSVSVSLWILFASVGVLLLIACSNVAGLLLARGAGRRKEMAVRAALGAGRGTLLRQSLAESLLLSFIAGGVGVLLTFVVIAVLIPLLPNDLATHLTDAPIDPRVLTFTLVLAIVTGVGFGIAPAVSGVRASLVNALHSSGRTTVRSGRLQKGLVVGQVTLTVVLLSAAGLLARSFLELTRDNLGFDPGDVLTVNVGLDGQPYDARGTDYAAFYQQVIERIEGSPGIHSAAAGESVPVIGPFSTRTPFHIGDGSDLTSSWWQDPDLLSTAMRMVTPGYFRTLEVPLVRGRDFSGADRRESPPVFVVNEAFAHAFFPDGDALDAPLSVFMNNVPGGPTARGRIIGIVGDVREGSLRGQAEPTLFYSYSQLSSSTDMLLFVRASNTAGVPRAVSDAVQAIDPNVPVTEPRLLDDVFGETIARERLNAFASAALAVTALLLATSGIYGLLSFMVTERKREIAIRMALGARVSEVRRMVLGQSLWLLIPGVALGLTGAVAFGAVIESLLYGIAPRDPVTFAGVVALMIGIGVLAAFLPARRATEVHPLEALRQE